MAKKLVKDDKKLFFMLSLLYSVGQLAMALFLFLASDLTTAFLVPFTVLGALFALLAWKAWNRRSSRITVRSVTLAVLGVLFLFFIISMLVELGLAAGDEERELKDILLVYLAQLSLFPQAVLLFLFPSAILAARKGARIDIRLLRTYGLLLTLLAVLSMLAVPDRIVPSFTWLGIDSFYLRLFYLVLVAASLVAIFASYPVFIKQLNRLVERARAKLKIEPREAEPPAEES